LILKAWVKFNDVDVECICTDNKKVGCSLMSGCEKYVIKFIPIMATDESVSDFNKVVKKLSIVTSKFTKEIDKLNKRIR